MINKKEILKLVKKITERERGLPDRRLMHPRREWALGVLVLFALSCGGGVYAFLTFMEYSDISVESEAVEVDQLRYYRADAQAAIDTYEAASIRYRERVLEIRSAAPVAPAEGSEEVVPAEGPEDEGVVAPNDTVVNENTEEQSGETGEETGDTGPTLIDG